MPISFTSIEQRRLGATSSAVIASQLDPGLPQNFPVTAWNAQQSRYYTYWDLYTGMIWTTPDPKRVDSQGNPALRFPLQINYAKTICNIHNAVLWGEVRDNSLPLAPHRVKPRRKAGQKKPPKSAYTSAEDMEIFLNEVWMQNDGRSLQQEGGAIQQFLGGIVYRVSWQPDDPELRHQIRIEMVIPDFFMPVWNTARPNELLECYVVYRLPAREAFIKYGYQSDGAVGPLYVEHWTKDSVSITLDGEPVSVKFDGERITYKNYPNPFGVVPFVYIPREKSGDFYGMSVLEDLTGLMMELNSRLADLGDILRDYAKTEVYVRNLSGPTKTQDIGTSRPAVNLGQTVPGSNHEPDAFRIDPPNMPLGLFNFPGFLNNQLMRDSSIPAVAFGEDEGSQRSALTLAFRMFPLINRVRGVRTHWTTAMNRIAFIIHKIASTKGINGITQAHWDENDFSVNWSPMLLRDSEIDLNTAVLSAQSQFMSPQTAMEFLNITEDPEREYESVMEHLKRLAEQQAQTQVQIAGKQPGEPATSKTQEVVARTVAKDT